MITFPMAAGRAWLALRCDGNHGMFPAPEFRSTKPDALEAMAEASRQGWRIFAGPDNGQFCPDCPKPIPARRRDYRDAALHQPDAQSFVPWLF